MMLISYSLKKDLTEKMQYEENQGSDPREYEYFPIVAQDVVENNNASINRIQNALELVLIVLKQL